MPIFPNTTSIAINHPILGYGTTPSEIGPMSIELALWLKDRLELVNFKKMSKDLEHAEFMEKSFQRQESHEWDLRCRLAGVRGYTHPLCNEIADFTPLGLQLAERVSTYLTESTDALQENPQVTDPDLWTKTEDVFLMGNITIRQAAMLKVLLSAINEAEQTNRTELDEQFRSAGAAERVKEEDIVRQARQSAKEAKEAGIGTFLNIFAERQTFNVPQAFQAKVYGYAIDPTNPMGHGPSVAFVPTAMFGHRARVDLKNLVKYGLVDMKAYITGVRGRPKHLVRVSTPGSIVVKDLTAKGII
jgi:hypothetical protein